MISKRRIRLSRNLHAQTTPYPDARRLVKQVSIFLFIVLGIGIYVLAKPEPSEKQDLSGAAPKEVLGEQKKAEALNYETYMVSRGDTLFNISQRYQISWQTLAEINNLGEPYTLKIGQPLKIPAK